MVKTDFPATEQKIIAAARAVFLQKGYAGARMQDIADAAGINKALLHYYFRNKEGLFDVIFKEAFGTLVPRINDIFYNDELSIFEKLEAFIDAYITMALENPFIPIFVFNALHSNADDFLDNKFPDHKKLPFKKAIADIEEAISCGLIYATDPMQLILHVLSLCLFPFLSRPMIQRVMQVSDTRYRKLMEARKQEVVAFVIRSIKKRQHK